MHEESPGSGNSQAAPTSPTNGTTQDPLKTTNISSVPRLNSSENVPAEKEAVVTPNRSDDDKGGWSITKAKIEIVPISPNQRYYYFREWKGNWQQKRASNARDDPTSPASKAKINWRCSRGHGGKQTQKRSRLVGFDSRIELSRTRTLIRTVIKIRLWTMVTTKSWWVRNV